MRPDRNTDTPTAKDWLIGFLAVAFVVIGAPSLVAAMNWLVHL